MHRFSETEVSELMDQVEGSTGLEGSGLAKA